MSEKARNTLKNLLMVLFVGIVALGITLLGCSLGMFVGNVIRHHVDGPWLVHSYCWGGTATLFFGPLGILVGHNNIKGV